MCGLAGWVYLDGRPFSREHDGPVLDSMGAAIHHRGPDDTQSMLWENVGFVFKRLSIVDLEGGRQPFETPDGRVCAMVNGEIYNHQEIRRDLKARHQLRSRSDCEVIPYKYLDQGVDLFEGVNGMFALALLDRQERRLLLARDRVGIKPLYYCLADNGKLLVFASELKGLFAHPAVPRQYDWLAALGRNPGYDVRPRELASFFHGIEKLPAGHILDLNLDDGRHSVRRYWGLPGRDEGGAVRSSEHYVEHFRDLLADSVRLRLMADVRYGLFLSGGIDSAAIAAFAASHKSFPTFSVMSRATVASGDAEASQAVAKHLGLPNHQILFDAPDIRFEPDDWRRILWACEYHIANPEQLYKYYLHAFARQRYPDLKVILLGQGSDEFNGGYISKFVNAGDGWEPGHWGTLGKSLRSQDNWRRAAMAGLTLDWGDLIQNGVLDMSPLAGFADADNEGAVWDRYQGLYRQNLDYHLWHEDRTASAHAVENRVPFLDHRLLEFMARIPVSVHAQLFTDKRILRQSMRGLLPEHIANREKGYFFIGPGEHHSYRTLFDILERNGGELVEQALEGSRASGGVLHPDGIRAVVREVGEDPLYRGLPRLLQLINMGLLADMAANADAGLQIRPELPVYETPIDEWAAQVSAFRAEAGTPNVEPHDDMVLAFGPGVSLVEVKTGGRGGVAPGTWCIVSNGQLSHALTSPAWTSFLAHVDGRRTAAEIVSQGQLNRIRIWKFLRQALDAGVLVEVPGAEMTGSIGAPVSRQSG